MKTDRRQKKRRSVGIRWRLFFAVLLPTILLVVLLWILQTVFLGVFYANIKTEELKKTANNIVTNLEKEDISDRILYLSSNEDINIRVIETEQFDTLYTSGEVFDSVTYGWGVVGMYRLYEETIGGGGEYVRYYSQSNDFDQSLSESPAVPEARPDMNSHDDNMREFRRGFEMVPRPGFFDNVGKHNDLLYSLITKLQDGTEIMIVVDTRISPLGSTVKVLKYQLLACSIVAVVITLVVSYVFSRHIAKPIEKLGRSAKVLASGNFDAKFDAKGYREIEELGDTLNYASSELEKVEKLRRELLSNVSHDMRTPLTMIVGYGEMMRDIPGENSPENVQVIIDEAKRLSEFVTNVLDLSKLESSMEDLKLEKVDITGLLSRTVQRYNSLLGDMGVAVEFVYDQSTTAVCDEAKITQALQNLIDNAINYAREPKKVVVRQTLQGDGTVRIEVSDNGDGIDKDELPYIWDRYYRTDKSHKRNIVGSGLGLSIVKQIFLLHGTKFGVETKKDEGSTFWFLLFL